MEKALLASFLILFVGRTTLRYVLQRLNMSNLKARGKVIPAVFAGEIDEATLGKIVDYTYDNSRMATKEDLFGDVADLAVLFLLVPSIVDRLAVPNIHIIVQALIFFGVLAAIGGIVDLPFQLYETFVLERKYGFSTITWKVWTVDLVKSVVLSVILGGIMISAFMAFISYLPKSWWFWGWIFFTLFELVLLWLYPVLIAPLFNRYEPVKDESLKEKIFALLDKVGLAAKGIYQVDAGKRSRHTNAYFTGIGRTKRIVLFDTLLASHSHDEIISVLAHEIGHWKKKHIVKQLIFAIGAALAVLYLAYSVLPWPVLYSAFRLGHTPVYAGLFLVSIYLGALKFFLSPLAAALMRKYEREADAMAFQLTGNPQPMINALKRLAKDNLSNLYPHPFYVWFYYSHPPLLERIEYLQAVAKNGS
jgi:STE24 endopeptidase